MASVKIFWSPVDEISDEVFSSYLELIPPAMREEVTYYRFVDDQKARLLARLMLLESLNRDKGHRQITNLTRNQTNRPYIEGWDSFNISHSGNMVVFCVSKTQVGIDIEKKENVDYVELIKSFHPLEQEFVVNSANRGDAFYQIWVKKEALLKAVGVGLVNGLSGFECLQTSAFYSDKHWFFNELQIYPDYTCYVCAADKIETVEIEKFQIDSNPYQALK